MPVASEPGHMRYAAFGSNLHPLRLRARVSSAELLGTGIVPGWQLCFHKRSADASAKCNIVEAQSVIYVAVYELDQRGRRKLDHIEGIGHGYKSVTIDVPGFGECYAYHAVDSHIDDSLQPYSWYKELVLLGSQEHGFPDDYCAAIAEIQAIEDPDFRRNDSHRNLIETLRSDSRREIPIEFL